MSQRKSSTSKSGGKSGLKSYRLRQAHTADSLAAVPEVTVQDRRELPPVSRTSAVVTARGRVIPQSDWERLPDDQLLDTRICDLGLKITSGSFVSRCVERLYRELESRGIRFRPHVWLGDEWFSPDGIPGIAIPFCLVHPRLRALERRELMEVEGGTPRWCMRILRHEAGHAIDTAWRLHRRAGYRKVFGNYFAAYPESYRPKPHSKRYVLHLEPWYAQSHPAEDFAETFAVWLTPRSGWRQTYADWPALQKLEFVDGLMSEIAGTPAKVRSRVHVDPVSRLTRTLREHYEQLHARYRTRLPQVLDHDLHKLFPRRARIAVHRRPAASFLTANRKDLASVVCHWTGEFRYSVNQVLRQMTDRCRQLDLEVTGTDREVFERTIVLLTVHTMNFLHGGLPRVDL
jgi:Putative zinc-binding metallo-peptidase